MSKPVDPCILMRADLFNIQEVIDMMVWMLEESKQPDRVVAWMSNLECAVSDLNKHCKIKVDQK